MIRTAPSRLRTPLLQDSVLDEQLRLETRAVQDGITHYRDLAAQALKRGHGPQLKPAERLICYWMPELTKGVRSVMIQCHHGVPGQGRHIHGPLLGGSDESKKLNLRAERIAYITMHTILQTLMQNQGGVKRTALAWKIGAAVVGERNLDLLRRDHSEEFGALEKRLKRMVHGDVNWLARRTLSDENTRSMVFTSLGAELFWVFFNTALIPVKDKDGEESVRPAISHTMRRFGRKSYAFIAPTTYMMDVIDQGHGIRELMRPRYLPMLVMPYKWEKDEDGRVWPGGYVRIRTPLITKITHHQREAVAKASMDRVYDGLHCVSGTAWSMSPLLPIVNELWRQGGGVCGLPRANPKMLPPPPAGFDEKAKRGFRWKKVAPDMRLAWRREYARAKRENIHTRSDRELFNRRLDIANLMSEREAFYFPHKLDFRGRCSPIPQPLNHHGPDVCRGLLQFAIPREPGERGERWLKVQAANMWGLDKVSFQDRVDWINANAAQVSEAAKDPLGTDWWHQAENPFQFLAACIALRDDGRFLPVQLDGTANGYQHACALGLDEIGAPLVNMVQAEKPAALYADIAHRVQKQVEIDAASGMLFEMTFKNREGVRQKHTLDPACLVGRVTKPIVKQPGMTKFYNVTSAGARKQIQNALAKAELFEDRTQRFLASIYLSGLVQKAISGLFVRADKIMGWLTGAAGELARRGVSPDFISPIGLPVVQPYRKGMKKPIRTLFGDIELLHRSPNDQLRYGRQKSAFIPNFNHSLDASHLMMTAISATDQNLTFAAVHDSDWTHAACVDPLNPIIRDEFATLHSRPLLEDLAAQLRARCPKAHIPPPPERGSLDLSKAGTWTYFFS